MSKHEPFTDPQLDGHERFRVSKENFGVSNDTRKIILEKLNEFEMWDTTLGDGLEDLDWDNDEYDAWYPDYPHSSSYEIKG